MRKSTIRKKRHLPITRKYYHLMEELPSLYIRLRNLGRAIEDLEFELSGLKRVASAGHSSDTSSGDIEWLEEVPSSEVHSG